jgi:chaperonin GroEL (HSP60 family)
MPKEASDETIWEIRALENIILRSSTKLMAGTAFSSILDGTTTVVVISQALEESLLVAWK